MKTRHFSIVVTILVIASVAVFYFTRENRLNSFINIPDEKAAGVALLARNQSGPGYFHLTAGPLARPGFMSRMEAHQQMGRVANERHLNAVEAERVAGLIDQIAEPSPNRTIESDRVNVMRLNLALDALP